MRIRYIIILVPICILCILSSKQLGGSGIHSWDLQAPHSMLSHPDPPILAFFDFLAFFVFRFSLLSWGIFPFFFKDFRGSTKRKTLAFLGENPCFFQKSKGWRVRASTQQALRGWLAPACNYSNCTGWVYESRIISVSFCASVFEVRKFM